MQLEADQYQMRSSGRLITIPRDEINIIDIGDQQVIVVVLDGKPVTVSVSDLSPCKPRDARVKLEPGVKIEAESVDSLILPRSPERAERASSARKSHRARSKFPRASYADYAIDLDPSSDRD
jgi:hypothetical protein